MNARAAQVAALFRLARERKWTCIVAPSIVGPRKWVVHYLDANAMEWAYSLDEAVRLARARSLS